MVNAIAMVKILICLVSPLGLAVTFAFLGASGKCAIILVIAAFVLAFSVIFFVLVTKEWSRSKPLQEMRIISLVLISSAVLQLILLIVASVYHSQHSVSTSKSFGLYCFCAIVDIVASGLCMHIILVASSRMVGKPSVVIVETRPVIE